MLINSFNKDPYQFVAWLETVWNRQVRERQEEGFRMGGEEDREGEMGEEEVNKWRCRLLIKIAGKVLHLSFLLRHELFQPALCTAFESEGTSLCG
jgi:hypothetical protein